MFRRCYRWVMLRLGYKPVMVVCGPVVVDPADPQKSRGSVFIGARWWATAADLAAAHERVVEAIRMTGGSVTGVTDVEDGLRG